MEVVRRIARKHYIKITASTALAVGLYKFAEYSVMDHAKGQSYPLAFLQNVYWVLKERLGFIEKDTVPYAEKDISKETIEYCLKSGGIILPDVVVKRISFRRMGSQVTPSQGRTYCIDISYDSYSEGCPVQVFLKISPTGFLDRLKARLNGW